MVFYWQIVVLLFIFLCGGTGAPCQAAVQSDNLTPIHGKLPSETPPEDPDVILKPHLALPDNDKEGEADPAFPVQVEVRINVPHWTRTEEHFVAYPYPPKPPSLKKPVEPLPDSPKGLKQVLLSSGYRNRSSSRRAYPDGGWRWRYAYNAALRHQGGKVPHTILEMYPWANSMVKYMLPEVNRINAAEQRRKQRLFRAITDYNRNHADFKAESIRAGIYPIGVKMFRRGAGRLALPAGTWWLVGYHKVPGLTYYWQAPVTAEPGCDMPVVTFNEQNALVIDGGW